MSNITLHDGVTMVTIPGDLEWSDEYDWQPVTQQADYTLTGALVVESAERLTGRPVTLAADDSTAWVDRYTVDALRTWAAIPGKTMTLTLADARQLSVVFRHQDAPALEARPVLFTSPPEPGDRYVVTLKFMEV